MGLKLPRVLYRGDSDAHKVRDLKATINGGVLKTNLCSGGSGKEIFNRPLHDSVVKHIKDEWTKTHFLSFSESEERAFYYGCNDKNYIPTDYTEQWDFAVMTLDTNKLIARNVLEKGIFSAEFIPTSKIFWPKFRVILIDTLSHLKSISSSNNDLHIAIAKAETDKEWLILPASPFANTGEFSGLLDVNCLSERRVFSLY